MTISTSALESRGHGEGRLVLAMYANTQPCLSTSSIDSLSSRATVQRQRVRSLSTTSLSSIGSYLSARASHDAAKRRYSLDAFLCRGSGSNRHSAAERTTLRLVQVEEVRQDVQASSVDDGVSEETTGMHCPPSEVEDDEGHDTHSLKRADSPVLPNQNTFRRWISTMRRKRFQHLTPVTPTANRWTLDDFEEHATSPPIARRTRHDRSESYASSTAFVSAVRSATSTMATMSIATVHRQGSKWRRGQQHSSLFQGSEPRPSVETQRSVMDDAAKQRSRRRREKLAELIRTEEGYLADLKALSSVTYATRTLEWSLLTSE
jgi:hypothetical protein